MKKMGLIRWCIGLCILLGAHSAYAEVCRTKTNSAWTLNVLSAPIISPNTDGSKVIGTIDVSSLIPGGSIKATAKGCGLTAGIAIRRARINASEFAAHNLAAFLLSSDDNYDKICSLMTKKLGYSFLMYGMQGRSYTNLLSPSEVTSVPMYLKLRWECYS